MRILSFEHFVAIVMTAALLVGCNDAGQKDGKGPGTGGSAAAGPAEVKVYEVAPEDVELHGASVRGMETAMIMAKVGGYVESISKLNDYEVDIGSYVQKGDVLAVVSVPEMEDERREKTALVAQAQSEERQAVAAIAQANAERDNRIAEQKQAVANLQAKQAAQKLEEKRFVRLDRLVRQKAAGDEILIEAEFAVASAKANVASGKAAIETAKAHIDAAEANVDKAIADKARAAAKVAVARATEKRLRTLIDYATIKAPFDGVITERHIDRGSFVQQATSNSGAMPLFKISSIDKVRIAVSVPSTKAAKVSVRQNATFHAIGGLPGIQIPTAITRSAMALDSESRMMRIEVHMDNPVKDPESGQQIAVLKPGMFGTLTVTLWDQNYQILAVPRSAVQTDQDGNDYVMVVDNNRCRRQPVESVFKDEKLAGISKGVKMGELVVLQNTAQLTDGQEISIKSE